LKTDNNNTILTIDDEAYIRKSIRTYLEDYGFIVFEAENGKTGIEIFQREKPDLVMLDLRMPEMDGLEVLRVLKKKAPDIPLIVASGTGNITSVVEALHLGAWDYILKPVQDMSVLYHSVTKCLNESRLKRENKEYQDRLEELVKERTRELEASEERYKAIFESTGSATIILDEDQTLLMVNARFLELSGWKKEELVGKKRLSELIVPEDLATLKLHCRQNESHKKNGHSPEHHELRFVTKNSGKRHVLVNEGLIPGTRESVVSLLDITEKKNAEKRWRSLEKQLIKSQKMEAIGTLAGGIAHDLNNILSPILGYADMLMRNSDPVEATFKRSEKIQKAALRAADLVSQILQFNRRDTEEKKAVKIDSVIQEVLKLLQGSIPSTINITDRIDNDCGYVEADPTQIHQVIMNLCTNAYHAMEETGGELVVSLTEVELPGDETFEHQNLKNGRYICLGVEDNGCGMDLTIQDRIFDPYYTTKEDGKGTGLGLSTVYSIVKNCKGDIVCTSNPGRGTCFKVLLPIVNVMSENGVFKQESKLSDEKMGSSLLVVDDDPDIADMCQEGFEAMGYKVKTLCSSVDALDYFKKYHDSIDLVVTDQTMPYKTGFDLARDMMAIRNDIPVILCSGHTGSVNSESAVAAGIKRFIMKPVTVDDLSRAIQLILNSD